MWKMIKFLLEKFNGKLKVALFVLIVTTIIASISGTSVGSTLKEHATITKIAIERIFSPAGYAEDSKKQYENFSNQIDTKLKVK